SELHQRGHYPYDGVKRCDESGAVLESMTFKQWAEKIQNSFESSFYIGEKTENELINRRYIYKDTVGATKQWMDFQLRPNFLVAMCVATELFDRQHALEALEMAE